MKESCPCCDYDLQGSTILNCPECGCDPKEVLQKRKQFFKTSRDWRRFFYGAIIYSTYLRFQFHAPPPKTAPFVIALFIILLLTILFFVFVSFMGVLMNFRKPYERRIAEFVLWFRCSFWIHLPWIILAPIRRYWPNDWRESELYLSTPYIILPFLALIIWMYRWKYLRKKAALLEQSKFAPTVLAIICIAIGWVAGAMEFSL